MRLTDFVVINCPSYVILVIFLSLFAFLTANRNSHFFFAFFFFFFFLRCSLRTVCRQWAHAVPRSRTYLGQFEFLHALPQDPIKWTFNDPTWAARTAQGFLVHAFTLLQNLRSVEVSPEDFSYWHAISSDVRIFRNFSRLENLRFPLSSMVKQRKLDSGDLFAVEGMGKLTLLHDLPYVRSETARNPFLLCVCVFFFFFFFFLGRIFLDFLFVFLVSGALYILRFPDSFRFLHRNFLFVVLISLIAFFTFFLLCLTLFFLKPFFLGAIFIGFLHALGKRFTSLFL